MPRGIAYVCVVIYPVKSDNACKVCWAAFDRSVFDVNTTASFSSNSELTTGGGGEGAGGMNSQVKVSPASVDVNTGVSESVRQRSCYGMRDE